MKVCTTLSALAAAVSLTACGNATGGAVGDSDAGWGASSVALTESTFAVAVAAAQADAGTVHTARSMEVMGEQAKTSVADIRMARHASDAAEDTTMSLASESEDEGEVEVRLVDGTAYLKLGSRTGGKFVAMDLSSVDREATKTFDEMSASANPNTMIRRLADGMQDFERTGETEEFDGVEATEYEITVDGSAFLGADSAGVSYGIPDDITYHVWIDDDNLMRKVTADFEIDSVPFSLELTLTDWGEQVHIEAPSSTEILEASTPDDSLSI